MSLGEYQVMICAIYMAYWAKYYNSEFLSIFAKKKETWRITGARADGIAQRLANELGVTVLAPSDTLWTNIYGELTIGPTANDNTGGVMICL